MLFVMSSASAQMKIGFVNIELVLFYMPESKTMNQELQTYQQKLRENIVTKQRYAQSKLEEYQTLAQQNAPTDPKVLIALETELMKLDEEIKATAAEADQKLIEKRQESLKPILEKVDANLTSLANEEGYDYILNAVDGNGVSIVLHGPQEHDLTEKIMNKLGIKIPAEN